MKNPFQNDQPKKTFELTPEEAKAQGFELTDEELAQTSGGYGHHHYHYKRWHYDRRWENGREVVIIVVDEY